MTVPKMPTQSERLAAVEIQQSLSNVKLNEIDIKLDTLLSLRDKGLGAFWLASALLGTGLVSILATFFGWFHR